MPQHYFPSFIKENNVLKQFCLLLTACLSSITKLLHKGKAKRVGLYTRAWLERQDNRGWGYQEAGQAEVGLRAGSQGQGPQ